MSNVKIFYIRKRERWSTMFFFFFVAAFFLSEISMASSFFSGPYVSLYASAVFSGLKVCVSGQNTSSITTEVMPSFYDKYGKPGVPPYSTQGEMLTFSTKTYWDKDPSASAWNVGFSPDMRCGYTFSLPYHFLCGIEAGAIFFVGKDLSCYSSVNAQAHETEVFSAPALQGHIARIGARFMNNFSKYPKKYPSYFEYDSTGTMDITMQHVFSASLTVHLGYEVEKHAAFLVKMGIICGARNTQGTVNFSPSHNVLWCNYISDVTYGSYSHLFRDSSSTDNTEESSFTITSFLTGLVVAPSLNIKVTPHVVFTGEVKLCLYPSFAIEDEAFSITDLSVHEMNSLFCSIGISYLFS